MDRLEKCSAQSRSVMHWRAFCPFSALAAIGLLGCNGNAVENAVSNEAVTGTAPGGIGDSPPVQTVVAVTCPSADFKEFIKQFANDANLQDAFSSKPVKHKYPYYWKHNSQPGDPANPKWVIDDEPGPARVKYRYDAATDKFVWVSKKLRQGQRWTSIDIDEKPTSYAQLRNFRIHRVSDAQYDVEYDKSDIDTYKLNSGCWYFSQRWEQESIVDCKWPDECRKQREYEASPK
ncbi:MULTISPECIES: hypothetical protein [unclassified Lysobacter]|uniref:hypothetical protein n=1 Tax=unclassified Lysobacter TaxID=2635362 RepID=UPI001BEB6C2D|nr:MULTISPECIES: hypothetical protein [unclassified Lysobacter]MBT2745552.1 hypothetical protein [Lysobacter sp. ISL-42]MBT2753491.1 hypothetical protein [Lysobacter sp. ISL-50]MBT2777125.1 hypothetical protein [Lysobacter sp. ISL-54]MBT2780249.1 hypothetical protein [Lysobacter sp. ISL-52]